VPILLKPCPEELLTGGGIQNSDWLGTRTRKAEDFWSSHFGDLDQTISTSAGDNTDPASKP
jgi:hypothetical protein